MADNDRQKPDQGNRKPAEPPREKGKERPGEGFERRPEPKGLEIEKSDRRGYGQDR